LSNLTPVDIVWLNCNIISMEHLFKFISSHNVEHQVMIPLMIFIILIFINFIMKLMESSSMTFCKVTNWRIFVNKMWSNMFYRFNDLSRRNSILTSCNLFDASGFINRFSRKITIDDWAISMEVWNFNNVHDVHTSITVAIIKNRNKFQSFIIFLICMLNNNLK